MNFNPSTPSANDPGNRPPITWTAPGSSGSASDAHKTLVSLGLIVVVMVLLVEVAGTSKTSGTNVLLLLLGIVMLLAVNQSARFGSFAAQYPFTPGSAPGSGQRLL